MASPVNLPSASTPDITITGEEMATDELHLSEAMLHGLPKATISSQKRPLVEEQPVPIISKGILGEINVDGASAITKPTQPITVRSRGLTESSVYNAGLASSVPTASTPSTPKQRPKILADLRKSISTTHLQHLFHHHRPAGTPGEKVSASSQSGTHSPLPDSSDVQDLFKKHNKKNCPDLNAVNKALNSLRAHSRPEEAQYVTSLAKLATSLEVSRADSKRALNQAMQARDTGRNEVCRSLCLSIVQNSHSDIDTRVFAYGILSTQASPGQAMNYIADALKLVQDNKEEHPEFEKLIGVIALLKDGALAKDGGCCGNELAMKANSELCELSMPPTIPKEILFPRVSKSALEVPKGKTPSGILTPKTEKILSWATSSKQPKLPQKDLQTDLAD